MAVIYHTANKMLIYSNMREATRRLKSRTFDLCACRWILLEFHYAGVNIWNVTGVWCLDILEPVNRYTSRSHHSNVFETTDILSSAAEAETEHQRLHFPSKRWRICRWNLWMFQNTMYRCLHRYFWLDNYKDVCNNSYFQCQNAVKIETEPT